MNRQHRILLRAAMRIHESYLDQKDSANETVLPLAEWEECQRLAKHLTYAGRRRWQNAKRHVQACLARAVRQLSVELEATQRSFSERRKHSAPPLRQIYEELCALNSEFADVEVDLADKTITATTEPVTLEGVYLGAFGIELDWQRLDQHPPYLIQALDPQPAASNSNIDHPHVDSCNLCEGDGRVAIHGALAEGRLLDFFVIVRQILNTYNSSSAYVKLESWSSVGCSDCGGSVDEDGRYQCEACESEVCDNCSANCNSCDSNCCSQCSARCHTCLRWYCKNCLRECAVCGEDFCKECLSHEECCECREDEEEESDEVDSDTRAAVHTDSLGEVVVPA